MLDIQRNKSLHRQISHQIEGAIFNGKLKAGDRIPSTTELAQMLKVNPRTVQLGLYNLSMRGFLDRTPGKGTFIRKTLEVNTIGIAFQRDVFSNQDFAFFSCYLNELVDVINERGYETRLFVMDKSKDGGKVLHDLKDAAEKGDIRGIVFFCGGNEIDSYISGNCPVPKTSHSNIDFRQMVLMGLKHLAENGHRDIMMIGYHGKALVNNKYVEALKYARKEECCKSLSVRTVSCADTMEDGHRAFIKDIKENSAIDGVLVTNDAVCRGVLYGILEKGLKIPEDIAVISHSNKGVNIFCHVPLTRLEVCPRDFAEKSVDSLIAKIKGEEYEDKKVLPRLLPGLSCGEGLKSKHYKIVTT